MKKNRFIFILALTILASPHLFSQSPEVNSSFLQGLSPEVQQDLQAQITEDSKSQNFKKYNSFSTMIYSEEEYPFFRLEKYIQDRSSKNNPGDLKRFGEVLFKGFSSTFMPVNEAAVGNDYILGPGDQLNILTMKGNVSKSSSVAVNRNGEIIVDKLGVIKVAGLSLQEAQELISLQADTALLGTKAFTTINEIRDIQLYVIGAVDSPGQYTLNGFSTILHALYVAGGPNEQGSFREIDLMRNGKKIATIDIYDLLVNGNNFSGNKLFSGDVIKVHPVKNIISVYGAINNPAIYELKPNESIQDVILFAGGASASSDQSITIKRVLDNEQSFVGLKNLNFNDSLLPISEDEIFFNSMSLNYNAGIRLVGAFENPGIYPLDINFLNTIKLDETAYQLALIRIRPGAPATIEILKDVNLKNAKDGDTFYALSIEDIQLLNSPYLQSLFLSPSKNILALKNQKTKTSSLSSDSDQLMQTKIDSIDIVEKSALVDSAKAYFLNECNALQHINDIKFSYLWNDVNDSLGRFVKSESQIADYFQLLETNALEIYQVELCSSIFNTYPQLLPSLYLNSIALTGQGLEGGLYPIPRNLDLEDFLDSMNMLESNNNPMLLITGSGINEEVVLSKAINTGIIVNPGQSITISTPQIDSERRLVTISGEVDRAGSYFISEGETVSSLIKKSGGYKKSAFFDGAILKRNSLKNKEQKMLETSYKEVLKSLSAGFLTGKIKSVDSGLLNMLEQLKNSDPTGRVVTEFDLLNLKRNPGQDMLLEHLDHIHIPRFKSSISIVGEVNRATEVSFNPKHSIEDYIRLAGGYTNIADKDKVYFVRPNGEIQINSKSLFAFRDGQVVPGSSIYIPRDDRPFTTLDISSNVAPVIASFALTAASLASINNN
jgi:polysaccharide biosynthesis/export protein